MLCNRPSAPLILPRQEFQISVTIWPQLIKLAQISSKSDIVGHNLAEFAQVGPRFGRSRPRFVLSRTNLCRVRPKLAQIWSILVRFAPELAEFGSYFFETGSIFVDFGPHSVIFGLNFVDADPDLVEPKQMLTPPTNGQCSATFALCEDPTRHLHGALRVEEVEVEAQPRGEGRQQLEDRRPLEVELGHLRVPPAPFD